MQRKYQVSDTSTSFYTKNIVLHTKKKFFWNNNINMIKILKTIWNSLSYFLHGYWYFIVGAWLSSFWTTSTRFKFPPITPTKLSGVNHQPSWVRNSPSPKWKRSESAEPKDWIGSQTIENKREKWRPQDRWEDANPEKRRIMTTPWRFLSIKTSELLCLVSQSESKCKVSGDFNLQFCGWI